MYAAEAIHVCEFCFGPLEVAYDHDAQRRAVTRETIAAGPPNMWRYADLLPVSSESPVDLGTGLTPLTLAGRLAAEIGLGEVWVKDDTRNPTGSFKDRVVGVALTKARELGFKIDNETPELKEILARIKQLEHEGFEFEAAEGSLALLIRKLLKHEQPPFSIEGYHVSIRRDHSISVCQASVKVLVDGKIEHTIAEGDGPVNALDQALRAALAKFFPQLKRVRLDDYKVRILNTAAGTGARTRVLIESTDGKDEWGTVGVHDNIIEASLLALSDSFEHRLSQK